ncbi:MAG: phenylacetate--CoA ligase family protein [Legionellales bacterium]
MSNAEELAARQTRDFIDGYHEHYNALFYSKKHIQAMRNERLRALLLHAKSNSPWYKKKLAHINIKHFTEERLQELPVLNKTTLMEHWDAIVTDKRLTLKLVETHIRKMAHDGDTLHLLNEYHVLSTSGSSGTRGIYIYNWDEWNKFTTYTARYKYYNQDRSALLLDGTKIRTTAMIVVSNTVYGVYSVAKSYTFNHLKNFYFPITLPMDQIISGLNEVQADVLSGIPSTIQKLCKEAQKGRLTIQPKVISVGAEPLYKPIRALIKKTWPNSALFNRYGSSEGLFGRNCHADSSEMHLNDDACIVELIDKWNNPLGKGVLSNKIYLTNLYNYTLPLIRYELNDQLMFLDKTCPCGIEHQLIAEPEGRPEYDFTYSNTIFIHHLVFVTPLLHEKNIQEYQVIQTKYGADIKIVSTGFVDKPRLQNTICTHLYKLGLLQPIINIIEVANIDRPESGKIRRFLRINDVI